MSIHCSIVNNEVGSLFAGKQPYPSSLTKEPRCAPLPHHRRLTFQPSHTEVSSRLTIRQAEGSQTRLRDTTSRLPNSAAFYDIPPFKHLLLALIQLLFCPTLFHNFPSGCLILPLSLSTQWPIHNPRLIKYVYRVP
jgi:hypothetical protein